ncbi:hypothetical protein GCM10027598_20930 [Amycolatopsis oliviviridis]|uniref:Secreted protein n=1 Tax=Amycolatopsis oliviviridis TaxID=1471590 RepID=A0ABQ3LFX3_9PSEU|nr:hypothetical protein [Amycolatopsis oliviviridis]GHH14826.1 hypothetical protein GCM10017790_28570 [Amycolatopsis oliviviridis]
MKGLLSRNLRRAVTATVVVSAATLAFTGTASASTGAGTGSGSEVYGSANWTWTLSGMKNINMAVRDTKCDGNPVYVFFEADLGMGTIDPTPYRWNENGCGTTNHWNNLKYNSGTKLSRVRVVVCVDDAGWDTCYRSGWQYNPEA